MIKTREIKIEGEVKTKKLMFETEYFETVEAAEAAGIFPETALTDEDVEGCEAVFEDDEA